MSRFESLLHWSTLPTLSYHVVLCSNLWSLNLAWSLGYLSSSAPLYAPCFLLVWFHFILVQRTGSTAHPSHLTAGELVLLLSHEMLNFFPAHVFMHSVCLCAGKKVPAAIWGSASHGWGEQRCSHTGMCTCCHSLQSLGTRKGFSLLLLVAWYSPASLPPRQHPKRLKDHFLVFV